MFLLLWLIALVMLLARAKVKCAINLSPFFFISFLRLLLSTCALWFKRNTGILTG